MSVNGGGGVGKVGVVCLTLALAYFLSVVMAAPLRWAALRALLPLMVVSRSEAPGPRTLLPILVTVSQSLMLAVVVCEYGCPCGGGMCSPVGR